MRVVRGKELVVSELLKKFLTFDKNCISNFWRDEESMIPLNCKSAICRSQGFRGSGIRIQGKRYSLTPIF